MVKIFCGPEAGARIAASSSLLILVMLSACGEHHQPETVVVDAATTAPPLTAAEVEAYLQAKVSQLAYGYPDIRIADFRMTPDGTLACGLLMSGENPPLVFMSADTTPESIERPVGMPNLTRPGNWADSRQAEGQALNRRVCGANGLLP